MAPSTSAQPGPNKTARPVASALVALSSVQVAARSNKFAATTQALCDLAAKGDLKSLMRFLEVTPKIEHAIDGEARVEALEEVLTYANQFLTRTKPAPLALLLLGFMLLRGAPSYPVPWQAAGCRRWQPR